MTDKITEERLAAMLEQLVELRPGPVRMAPADVPDLIAGLAELQSLRQSHSTGAVVKGLEWKENSATSLWTGELAFRTYYTAYDEGNGWRCFRGQFLSEAGDDEIAYGAKPVVLAAAQSDYERQILSYLYTHPKEAEVTVTEEMAKGLFEWACDDLLPAYGIEASRFDSELAEACRVGLVAALSRKG